MPDTDEPENDAQAENDVDAEAIAVGDTIVDADGTERRVVDVDLDDDEPFLRAAAAPYTRAPSRVPIAEVAEHRPRDDEAQEAEEAEEAAVNDAPPSDAPDVEPPAPDSLPKYVVDDVSRQSPERLLDLAPWAERLARWKEVAGDRELDALLDSEAVVEVEEKDGEGATYTRMVECGDSTCTKCPHGPYRYRSIREGDKVRTEYVGPA